jgi:hypothetical protein
MPTLFTTFLLQIVIQHLTEQHAQDGSICYPEVYRRQQQLLAQSGPAEDIT